MQLNCQTLGIPNRRLAAERNPATVVTMAFGFFRTQTQDAISRFARRSPPPVGRVRSGRLLVNLLTRVADPTAAGSIRLLH